MAQTFVFPQAQGIDANVHLLNGAQLLFEKTGTATPQTVYQDAALTTPHANPVVADSAGVWPPIYLDDSQSAYRVTLYSSVATGSVLLRGPIDPCNPFISTLTQIAVGTALYPRTAIEVAIGVTPVNYYYPTGYVDRYGTNTTPGTTPMMAAVQAAVNVAIAAVNSGKAGIPVRYLSGVYAQAGSPSFGSASSNYLPLDIAGAPGFGTQIINTAASGTSDCFDLSGFSGVSVHDFVLSAASSNKNNGIRVGNASSSTQGFYIERIAAFMPGYGIVLHNTNTGIIREFQGWGGSASSLMKIVPTVTLTDVNHDIYMTGGFVHNVSIYDSWVTPGSNFASGQCGIKLDAQSSYGVSIVGCLCQTRSGTNSETGIDINPSGSVQALTLQGIYCEGTAIKLTNVSNSTIESITDGAAGGSLIIGAGSRQNSFEGINIAVLTIADTSCYGNTWDDITVRGADAWSSVFAYVVGVRTTQAGVTYTCILGNTNQVPPNATYWSVSSSYTDGSDATNFSNQPNYWRRISLPVVGPIADRGQKWRKIIAYSASIALDAYSCNHAIIRVTNGTAFTIVAPTHPYNGQEMELTIRNESGGAMGAITWSGTGVLGWVNPANGFNRSVCIYYDTDFAAWRTKWVGTVDQIN